VAEDDIINMVEQAVSKQSQGACPGQVGHDKRVVCLYEIST